MGMWLTSQTGHLNSVGTDNLGDKTVAGDGGNEASGSENHRVTHFDYVWGEVGVWGNG